MYCSNMGHVLCFSKLVNYTLIHHTNNYLSANSHVYIDTLNQICWLLEGIVPLHALWCNDQSLMDKRGNCRFPLAQAALLSHRLTFFRLSLLNETCRDEVRIRSIKSETDQADQVVYQNRLDSSVSSLFLFNSHFCVIQAMPFFYGYLLNSKN